jgi:hypothetical protein
VNGVDEAADTADSSAANGTGSASNSASNNISSSSARDSSSDSSSASGSSGLGGASRVAARLLALAQAQAQAQGGSPAVDTFAESDNTAGVVALQADDDKVVAVYADGVVRSWDVNTGGVDYVMQGRSGQVSSLQFDGSRLLVDGTHSVVVVHEYGGVQEGVPEMLEYVIRGGEDEGEGEEGEEGDDGEDGIPSSTT